MLEEGYCNYELYYMEEKKRLKACRTYAKCRDWIMQSPERLRAVLAEFLGKIEREAELNAFVRVYEEEANARVEELVKSLQQGNVRPLTGMMVGIKDLFCYKDHPVQASSAILKGFISQISATAVERLQAAGAVILGHQNSDEFGMGSANENSIYGRVANPIDKTRTAGGSSGGSAAAVAGGQCHVALGTDTGGSVRQPAALCGLVGLKPTYSRIPRDGVVAYSSSFDTVGIFSHTVEDCATTLQVLAGAGERDNTSAKCAVPAYREALKWKGKQVKVALLKETLTHPALQPEIKAATVALLDKLKEKGHEVAVLDFPLLAYALPTYYVLTTAEASANLARYDGVRYGPRAKDGTSFDDMLVKTRTAGFGKEVKRRLLLGSFVLSADYFDSYYTKAQKVRRLIRDALVKILAQYEFIICPTTPTTAFSHGSTNKDPLTQYLADLYTVPASVAGLPAISIPNGTDANGLPIGVQLMGRAFKEEDLLAFAAYLLGEG